MPPGTTGHVQEPHPALPVTPRLPESRAQPPATTTGHPHHVQPHPGTRRGQRGWDPGTPPCLPPAVTTLTGLHGEEEEEEGSGSVAPAAGGRGPCARQPHHGFARASAGGSARCGRAVPAGAYVGHEPSQPSQPAPPHRLVETGTCRYHGNGSQPQSIPPWPPVQHPQGVVPGYPGEPRAPCGAGTTRPRHRRTAMAPRAATALCAGSLHSGHSAERPPRSPCSWVFMRPSPSHHHGIRAAGRNCLPFSQPLQPRRCVCCAAARGRPPLAPRPPPWLLRGFAVGLGGGHLSPAALVPCAGNGDGDTGAGWGPSPFSLQQLGTAGGGHPSAWERLVQPEQTPLLFVAPVPPPGVGSGVWSPHMGHSRGQTPQTWARHPL